MIRRFQIEDLIVQDASGVIFRAIDTETGHSVAVRRFFPFGADGGGLDVEEQAAYNIAVVRLAGLRHSALRAVVCGGCDPVDGMPFIVTEWIDGDTLNSVVAEGPLSVESTAHLVSSALEVSELLSHVLAEEAVWVETDLQTIIVGAEGGGRRFTLWISPLKWLGGGSESRGLQSIITLTEELMGWSDRMVNDQAGRGLGAWLNWLRGAAATATLTEVREMLAASIGEEPPEPAKQLVVHATRPLKRPVRKSSFKAPVFAAFGLLLVIGGVAGWIMSRQDEFVLPEQVSVSPPDTMEVEKTPVPTGKPPAAAARPAAAAVSDSAAELRAEPPRIAPKKNPDIGGASSKAEAAGSVIQWNNHKLLVKKNGQQVIVEGVFEGIGHSSSKKTLFLNFSKKPGRNDSRGAVLLSSAEDDLSEAALKPLVGKLIRIHGAVDVEKTSGLSRPEIHITRRGSIKVIE